MFFTKKERKRVEILEKGTEELKRLYKEVLEIVKGTRPVVLVVDHSCGHPSVSYAKRRDGTTICLDCYCKQFPIKEEVNGSL